MQAVQVKRVMTFLKPSAMLASSAHCYHGVVHVTLDFVYTISPQVPGVYLAALGLIRALVGPPAVLERRDCSNIVWELLPLLIDRVRMHTSAPS